MIPGLLANEVASALREFIVTGFETETPPFAGEFRRLVDEQLEGEAFIKGPFISIGLPFRGGKETRDWFSGFQTDFPPYAHQEQAWQRLASNGSASNTLVATGTGSGKTECFLYPVLDHCKRNRGPGIKAIVIYPMNALATDQAKRFAKVIHSQPGLKGTRVGLFVGGGEHSAQKEMSEEGVIACKETLRQSPPDILLTNYKMLDYLLMRPKDQALWAHNGPSTLRYLVVDELHTFDGAQGTDLALLIRRLRARFNIAQKQLINVGTSATLGSPEQATGLLRYAEDVFSSPFTGNAVVAEQRQTEAEFIGVLEYLNLNADLAPERLSGALSQDLEAYLNAAYELYFCEPPTESLLTQEGRIELGWQLRTHGQLSNLLRQLGSSTAALGELRKMMLSRVPKSFAQNPEYVVLALLALLAQARNEHGQPLVQLRVQLWARELRRIVARLEGSAVPADEEPLLSFADDKLNEERSLLRLPLVQCRECHGTAWLTRIESGQIIGQKVVSDLSSIYSGFFGNHAETAVLLPGGADKLGAEEGSDYRVCRYCGTLTSATDDGDCPGCQADKADLIKVLRPRMQKSVRNGGVNRVVHENHCPYCRASGGLIIFGARAASLSAVAVHQLFSSRDNDDKKLIAFSDSVQDATHRAGFFSARTWHNNIRMALTHVLDGCSGPLSLLGVQQRFEKVWLESEGGQLPLERYLREFMPPDARYRGDFEEFERTGKVVDPAPLLGLIRERILWEALEDLTWRSQVGRSLNRVGIAAVTWDPDLVSNHSESWASEVYNALGFEISTSQAATLLNGLMQHMVQRGAVWLREFDTYLYEGSLAYLLNKLSFTPSLGPSSPRPHFPALKAEAGFDPLSAKSQTWYQRWFASVVPDQLLDPLHRDKILESALDALVAAGLLRDGVSKKGTRYWGIEPERLALATDVIALTSDNHRPLHIAKDRAGEWIGAPLIEALGHHVVYTESGPVRASLYQSLYRHGDVHRVIAHEHTGLLAREDREEVERSFIAGDGPWEYNLLSATPTLEMGIDIGDLSSVLLCSVPPAQANYLQRVGRGGRRDGNSFVLTLANGRPHDLVFYADPKRMLEAPIEPPAIFLKARHVLRRQLLAYAMDCWTRDSRGDNQIPTRMQPVLDAVESNRGGAFPYTLLDYIRNNMQQIWEDFCEFVASGLDEDNRELLGQYLFGGPQHQDDHLQLYVNGRLQQVVEERSSIANNIASLQKQLKLLEKQPDDEHRKAQIEEIDQELTGYKRLRWRLNQRETLNFFTDEGLLPNYAFPEEGATLHSIIFRTEKKEGERELVKREYEYQRPAQAALTELAPESVFYAGNRRVKISRVETSKGRNIQQWRFCPRCHYSTPQEDPNGGFQAAACPRCASPMWADQSARTRMLKMTQVYAFTNAKDAMLDDRSDDREPAFFNKQMLIDFAPEDVEITWILDDDQRPFGFEFVRKARFLEVNFGRRDQDSLQFEVAGQNLNRAGFPICEDCGSVQPRRGAAVHLKSCTYNGRDAGSQQGQQPGIVNCLYLYRQFTSEALRILVPRLSSGGTETQLQSFIAALQLGLKRRFGGKVDHLRVAYQSEPVGQTDEKRHFLVLYDSVPGGTGYLHDLLSDALNMQSVFREAFQVMNECDCYGGTMDGCYRCLLEYRNSYGMEDTRKSVALELLAEIVDSDRTWKKADQYLSRMKSTSWVDSELEARFPEALEKFSGRPVVEGKRVRVFRDVVRRKNGFRLIIGTREYEAEPHVLLGPAQGVQFKSEADFVLWPSSTEEKPVAIFLDGYEYHADIVQDDLLKRQALMHAGYVVWSLNWYDINQVMGGSASEVPLLSRFIHSEHSSVAVKALTAQLGAKPVEEWAAQTNFEYLLSFLDKQDYSLSSSQSWLFALSTFPARQFPDSSLRTAVKALWEKYPAEFIDRQPADVVAAANYEWQDPASMACIGSAMLAGPNSLDGTDLGNAALAISYQMERSKLREARPQWQCFWTLVNILQFLSSFYAYTISSLADGAAAGLHWPVKTSATVPDSSPTSGASAWLSEIDPELAEELMAKIDYWPEVPEVGYELLADSGEIVGEAELAFEVSRVALLLDAQMDSREAFERLGWTVVSGADELKHALGAK
ncbi:DEAD/DEAH box helicase [Microbulbifer marinus]|uniref:DEAD/DEAH box helicase domain-containing protein n=1 Tax=Microbulbifer marinus TaxID=658218 RepID=A0A1H3ZAF6_9GAMM|nr:DEAD/DEAH box helicase [Microbulbifer marinus]SEA20615.1 DEAD/DEAH box helicase domain-containing protein [Microbulbifer marinus]